MRRQGQVRAGLGVPSLVLILLVLCLALLGVLSLISARADSSMAARYAQLAQCAAQADAQAQRALAQLDAQMAQAWLESENDASYSQGCTQIALADGVEVKWTDAQRAVMQIDAGAQRTLDVEICRSSWEEAGKGRFTIEKYALSDGAEWGQTEGLELIGLE